MYILLFYKNFTYMWKTGLKETHYHEFLQVSFIPLNFAKIYFKLIRYVYNKS